MQVILESQGVRKYFISCTPKEFDMLSDSDREIARPDRDSKFELVGEREAVLRLRGRVDNAKR